jgi:cell division protein FtsB
VNKNTLLIGAVAVLLALFVGQNLLHQFGAYKDRIKAVEAEKAALVAGREELQRQVADLTRQQEQLQATIARKDTAIAGLRQEVKTLEAQLHDDRAEIVRIQTDDDSVVRFKREFPEFSRGLRMVERKVPGEKHPEILVPVNYIMLPVGFVDHFIELKKTAANLEAQKAKLVALDALHTEVSALKDQIIRLGQEKEASYSRGYEEAFAKYLQLSEDYVKLMKEKRISAGMSLFQAIGGFVGGVAIGAAL